MALGIKKNLVGIYIDSKTIAVASGVKSQGSQIESFAEIPCSNVLDKTPEQKQQVLSNLRATLAQAKIRAKNASIAVPGELSITRYFELPILPKKEERGAVRFEAQKYIPIDIKDLYYDYQVYLDTERKRIGVVLFACKKQWVDAVSALMPLSGLKLSSVELACQPIARSFYKLYGKNAQEVVMILSANGDNTAEIVIEKNAEVLTTRHLSLALNDQGIEVSAVLLISDIRISLDYFSENFKKEKISRIYLCTPFSANAQHLCESLKNEFNLPVELGSIVPIQQSVNSSTASAAAYGLNIFLSPGKGMKNVSLRSSEAQAASNIGMSWEDEKKIIQDLVVKEILGVLLFLALFYGLFYFLLGQKIQKFNVLVSGYPAAESAKITDDVASLEAKQNEIIKKLGSFGAMLNNRVYVTAKLNEIVKITPAGIQLVSFRYDNGQSAGSGDGSQSGMRLQLDGYVTKAEGGSELSLVNKYATQLGENKEFMIGLAEVKVISTRKESFNGIPSLKFSIDCVTTRNKS